MTRKRVVLSGGTGGIGTQIVRRFADLDYDQTLIVRNEALAQSLCADVGIDADVVLADLADPASIDELRKTLANKAPFDVAVLNAGYLDPCPVAESEPADLTRHISVNLVANMHIVHAVLPEMLLRGTGHIIAVVSMGGIIGLENYGAYSASKFGLRGFLWSLHEEVRDKGVRVTGIYSSGVDTPMLRMEAESPFGSDLNFLAKPSSPDRIAERVVKALDRNQLETYVPYSDSVAARAASLRPSILAKLLPLLNRVGKRGRKRFNNDRS